MRQSRPGPDRGSRRRAGFLFCRSQISRSCRARGQRTARILAIPPATPEKYRGMVDMKGWRNPYLIIRADGVALLDPDNHLERILKPGELTQALGNLPPVGVALRARGRGDRKWRARFRRR